MLKMPLKRTFAAIAAAFMLVSPLQAQQQPATLPGQQAATPAAVVKVEKNTVLQFSLMQPLDPSTAKPGDDVPLRLTQPLTAGGVVVLPVGSVVYGRVTKVTPAGPRCTRGSVKWKLDQVQLQDGSKLKTEFGNRPRSATHAQPRPSTHVQTNASQRQNHSTSDTVGYVIQDAVLLPLVVPGLAIYEVRKVVTAPFRHGSCSRWHDLPLPANTAVGFRIREDHEVRLP